MHATFSELWRLTIFELSLNHQMKASKVLFFIYIWSCTSRL